MQNFRRGNNIIIEMMREINLGIPRRDLRKKLGHDLKYENVFYDSFEFEKNLFSVLYRYLLYHLRVCCGNDNSDHKVVIQMLQEKTCYNVNTSTNENNIMLTTLI